MMTGYDPSLEPLLFESMLRAGLAGGGTLHFVSPQDSEQIFAVGLWFGPGKKMFAT